MSIIESLNLRLRHPLLPELPRSVRAGATEPARATLTLRRNRCWEIAAEWANAAAVTLSADGLTEQDYEAAGNAIDKTIQFANEATLINDYLNEKENEA